MHDSQIIADRIAAWILAATGQTSSRYYLTELDRLALATDIRAGRWRESPAPDAAEVRVSGIMRIIAGVIDESESLSLDCESDRIELFDRIRNALLREIRRTEP